MERSWLLIGSCFAGSCKQTPQLEPVMNNFITVALDICFLSWFDGFNCALMGFSSLSFQIQFCDFIPVSSFYPLWTVLSFSG